MHAAEGLAIFLICTPHTGGLPVLNPYHLIGAIVDVLEVFVGQGTALLAGDTGFVGTSRGGVSQRVTSGTCSWSNWLILS